MCIHDPVVKTIQLIDSVPVHIVYSSKLHNQLHYCLKKLNMHKLHD